MKKFFFSSTESVLLTVILLLCTFMSVYIPILDGQVFIEFEATFFWIGWVAMMPLSVCCLLGIRKAMELEHIKNVFN